MENYWCGVDEEGCVLMEKEKFSVLLSLYKNEKPEFLRQALDSLLNQTVLPDEILVVKDGPLTEELEEVLNDFSQKRSLLFRFISFEYNRGLGLALRDGVEACKNELIARMDTDDVCKPDRFEKQLLYLKQNPEVALLGTAIEEFSENINNPDSKTVLPLLHSDIIDFAKKRNPFRHMTVMFKKSAVMQSGNYRHFLWFEDYDLWVRMIDHGYLTANLPEVLVSVRAGEDMFARRGGMKYSMQDLRFEYFLFRINFINCFQLCINTMGRILVRLLPNRVRIVIYQKLLR